MRRTEERLRATMQPVEPDPRFRAALRASLVSHPAVPPGGRPRGMGMAGGWLRRLADRGWVTAAAVVLLALVASATTYSTLVNHYLVAREESDLLERGQAMADAVREPGAWPVDPAVLARVLGSPAGSIVDRSELMRLTSVSGPGELQLEPGELAQVLAGRAVVTSHPGSGPVRQSPSLLVPIGSGSQLRGALHILRPETQGPARERDLKVVFLISVAVGVAAAALAGLVARLGRRTLKPPTGG